jgi:hypothetical protein
MKPRIANLEVFIHSAMRIVVSLSELRIWIRGFLHIQCSALPHGNLPGKDGNRLACLLTVAENWNPGISPH